MPVAVASSRHGCRRSFLRRIARRGPCRDRSGHRGAPRRRARAAARADRADRVGELHLAVDPRGRRLGADEQVRGGIPGQAVLRRLRDRRPDRAAGDRPGQGALPGRARERPAPCRCAGEHGGVSRAAAAGRHGAVAPARPRRPSDPRAQGQLLGAALHDRSLRRFAGDEPSSTTTRCWRSPRSTGPR